MSKYRYVYPQQGNRLPWVAKPKTFRNGEVVNLPSKSFSAEEDAAIYVDEVFIANGLGPVNVLTEKPAPGLFFNVREFECWITGGPRSQEPMTVQRMEARRANYSPVKARLRLTVGKQRTKMGPMPSVKEYVNLNL